MTTILEELEAYIEGVVSKVYLSGLIFKRRHVH